MDLAALLAGALCLAGIAQCLAGWTALVSHNRRRTPEPRTLPPVTILKPLHGDEPLLEQALASNFQQDYPEFQLVFGLQNPSDPAIAVLDRLRKRFPNVQADVVVDATTHGANRKVANLINMLPRARHDVLVIADSDMHVAPGYLRSLVSALAAPGAGVVTTIYTGHAAHGAIAGQLGAAQINHAFLPGVLLSRRLGRRDCLGATMALTRDTLGRIGGFQALKDHLADDGMLGNHVRAIGLGVHLATTVPATTVPETRMPDLFDHELRWSRTVRALAPVGLVLSVLQYPLFWAVLALAISGGQVWAWGLLAAAWLVRAVVARAINRSLGIASPIAAWWLPVRDVLSMAVVLATYRTRRVAWRGYAMTATRSGLTPGKGLIVP